MNNKSKSIFNKYYSKEEFIDRSKLQKEKPIDVIIPLINTNELFEKNLCSFYREIPINRLIIGNGGCTDNSIEIVKKFPRVKVINQTSNCTVGYRTKKLIENVETEWFIFLHADVYLPENWYDKMKKYQKKYDWFECYRKMTTLVEFWSEEQHKQERAFSGSQMGRKKAFENILPKIDDDYLYRNEEIIFQELIIAEGYKYARISDTFHYHQIMNKRGEMEPKFKKLIVEKEKDKNWQSQISNMQARSIIKYLKPKKKYLIDIVNNSIYSLYNLGTLDWQEFKKWTKKTNPIWLKYIKKKGGLEKQIVRFVKKIYAKYTKNYK